MTSERPPAAQVDLSDEGVHWDLGNSQSYAEYLRLDRLLASQQPLSGEHDEMLFIIVHQVSELWMRLLLHELEAVADHVRRDDLGPSFKLMTRIGHIQQQLLQVWTVLATLTPADYSAFRNVLGRSSGFQSVQYRLLEFALGNRNAAMLRVHERDVVSHARLLKALHAPSLYDEVLRLLSRRGYGVPEPVLGRDLTQAYEADRRVAAAWLGVYHNARKDWDLYELGEKLVDLDHNLQLWRFQHMKTVERIIGHKPGTGGTSGVGYLAKALQLRAFPELWQVRTAL
ncbi:MAG: tryptophan 2,3-dioxygenase [Pseudomonadota bacterium]|jgi:tryptophan 2,3-dioxygenase